MNVSTAIKTPAHPKQTAKAQKVEQPRLQSKPVVDAERSLTSARFRLEQAKAQAKLSGARLATLKRKSDKSLLEGSGQPVFGLAEARAEDEVDRHAVAELTRLVKEASEKLSNAREAAPSDAEVSRMDSDIESAITTVMKLINALSEGTNKLASARTVASQKLAQPRGLIDLSIIIDMLIKTSNDLRRLTESQVLVRGSWRGCF